MWGSMSSYEIYRGKMLISSCLKLVDLLFFENKLWQVTDTKVRTMLQLSDVMKINNPILSATVMS